MFKTQFKKNSPFETWSTVGSYSSETQAISAAIRKKNAGAVMVRVTDRKGGVVYTG